MSKYRDPLHILLEYIAEVSTVNLLSLRSILIIWAEQSAPDDCDIVLVHDDDLALLDGFGDDSVS